MPKKKIKSKDPYDRFFTKSKISKKCVDLLLKYTDDNDMFFEPSAGSGSFFNHLPKNKMGIDIIPAHDSISQGDYLTYDFTENGIDTERLVVVGNPPYGSRNKLTNEFIKKSLTARVIAFILPAVYKKETMQKVFPENWCLVESIDLEKNAFLLNEKEYHVPTIFQIWIKDSGNSYKNLRESQKKTFETTDFTFVNKKEDAKYFIFGASPAKIVLPNEVKETNRGYWVDADQDVINRLESIDWKKHALSTVSGGVAWFTKKQIVNIYGETYYDFRQ